MKQDAALELLTLVRDFFERTLPAMSNPEHVYVVRYEVGTGNCAVQLETCQPNPCMREGGCKLGFEHMGRCQS